jgi:glycosyltransferase involved in cell wall biosynthesis
MVTDARAISVITPVHNVAGARRTFTALAAQQRAAGRFELIVVDDGSTDDVSTGLSDALDPFADCRVVKSENRGPSAARNEGAAVASGDYLVFLDADDEPLAGWLAAFTRLLGDGIGIAHCEPDLSDAVVRTDYGFRLAGCFAISKRVFDSVGGYDAELRFAENTDLVERAHAYCASHGLGVARTGQELLAVHQAGNRRRYDAQRLAAMTHLLERDAEALRHDPGKREQLARIGAVCAVRTGEFGRARALAWTAVRARPVNPRNWLRLMMVIVPPLGRRRWRA